MCSDHSGRPKMSIFTSFRHRFTRNAIRADIKLTVTADSTPVIPSQVFDPGTGAPSHSVATHSTEHCSPDFV